MPLPPSIEIYAKSKVITLENSGLATALALQGIARKLKEAVLFLIGSVADPNPIPCSYRSPSSPIWQIVTPAVLPLFIINAMNFPAGDRIEFSCQDERLKLDISFREQIAARSHERILSQNNPREITAIRYRKRFGKV